MAKKIITFDDGDIAYLKRQLGELRAMPRNNHNFQDVPKHNPAQDVHIAKLPTGTGIVLAALAGSAPGTADCIVYKLDQAAGTISAIVNPDTTEYEVPVYNFYPIPWVGGDRYVEVKREKGGAWITPKPPTKYRAILNDDLDQGGTSTARIFYRNSANTAWVDSIEDFDVVEFVLNTDEKFVQYQKGEATWDEGGVWVFDSTACAVADDTGLFP